MLHPYEEQDNDRFGLFFSQTVGGGKEVLSPLAVFVINAPRGGMSSSAKS